MKHTPGIWKVEDNQEEQVYIYSEDGTYIAEVSSDAGPEEARANAHHIVACVNRGK